MACSRSGVSGKAVPSTDVSEGPGAGVAAVEASRMGPIGVTALLARLVGTVLVKLRMFILSRGDIVYDSEAWSLGTPRESVGLQMAVPASELDEETISDEHLSLIASTYVGCSNGRLAVIGGSGADRRDQNLSAPLI